MSDQSVHPCVLSRDEILAALATELAVQPHAVTVAGVKISRVREFNHAYGLASGDEMLQQETERVVAAVGDLGLVGTLERNRVLVVAATTNITALTRNLQALAELPVGSKGEAVRAERDIALVCSAPGAATADLLIEELAAALREARSIPETPVHVAGETVRAAVRQTRALERDLGRALSADELHFEYQPIYSLQDGATAGVEALLRWDHPDVGPVPPTKLVTHASRLGLLDELTKWSIGRIGQDWAAFRDRHPDPDQLQGLMIGLNLGDAQLSHRSLPSLLGAKFADYDLEPNQIAIEIVESGPSAISRRSGQNIRELAAQGFNIVLDDFGTGYNALAYFLRFPINSVKIDRQLIEAIPNSRSAHVVVDAIVSAAHNLGATTVAEGIESEIVESACRDLGLQFGQGWLRSLPGTLDSAFT